VFLSFKVSGPDVSQSVQVTFDTHTVSLVYQDFSLTYELPHDILPELSLKSAATAKKLELKMRKSQENFNWMSVEKGGEAKLLATASPSLI
jgi:hypothetical protein